MMSASNTGPAAAAESQAQILRSTSIIGASTAVSMLLGLARGKVIALVLGPAGLGLIGILNNLMSTAANAAALGMGTSGVRRVAESVGHGQENVARTRRALLVGMALLALLGGGAVWLARGILAGRVLGDEALSPLVGWLALGVALLIAAGSQGALLNGLRRIGDLARLTIGSAVLATVAGLAAIVLWGEAGILVYLLAAPLAAFLLGHWLVSRIDPLPKVEMAPREYVTEWSALARLGVSFMVAGLVLGGGLLLIRASVQAELGSESLGLFEAAWAISMTYLGAIMTAMGTDFYPRLTALNGQPVAATALVNDQTRVALWLCGPVCVAVIGLAPWVLALLYSSAFTDAATVLRWQIFGDILKVLSWPLGFVLLAAGDGKRFVIGEAVGVGTFAAVVLIGLPRLGLVTTGMGFFAMYSIYLPLVYFWARRRIAFRWTSGVKRDAAILLAAASTVAAAAAASPLLGALVGALAAVALGVIALWHLSQIVPPQGPVGRLSARLQRAFPVRQSHG